MQTQPTVLILDDSEIALGMYAALLEEDGMSVHGASSLFDFEDLVRERRPSLILCDVQMPDLVGDSVVRVLRSQYDLDHVPIVLLSALSEHELAERAGSSGADGYIRKATPPDQFAARVREFLAPAPA